MGNIDKGSEKYKNYFEARFARYGENVKSLWGSKDSQFERFEVLTQIGNLEGKSILDVGCGFGDLYDFLVNHKKICIYNYIGIDAVPKFAGIAKERYPGATFVVTDILDSNLRYQVDYALASGIFFLPDSCWENRMIQICLKMFALSKCGIAVNYLSKFSPNKDDLSFYADPSRVTKLMMERLYHKIVLRHDYRANDFTIYVYKAE